MYWLAGLVFTYYICKPFAGIAQLVEHDLAKVGVAGPSPVSRSNRDEDVHLGILFLYKMIRAFCLNLKATTIRKPGWRNW
jgi:hypothetical protein